MTPVFINARFLTQPLSGVQRYALEICRALDGLAAQRSVGPIIALYPARQKVVDPGWQNIELRRVQGGRGHFWEQTALWQASRTGRLISLCNSGPLRHDNQIVALHDANIYAIPGAFSHSYRIFHSWMRPRLARRARRLITVSAFSAQELARYCGLSATDFRVIPNSADHLAGTAPDLARLYRFNLKPDQYLLAVGNQSPNKNIARLVAAHAQCPDAPVLAIAGGGANGLTHADIKGDDRIRNLGRIPDNDLVALYKGAKGFVWPSLYEGFGIPPLEAMALGTPVLSSSSSAMPDVLGDAAMYFDPSDTNDILRCLRAFQNLDPVKLDQIKASGCAQARRYSWMDSANTLLDIVEEMPIPASAARAQKMISFRSSSEH